MKGFKLVLTVVFLLGMTAIASAGDTSVTMSERSDEGKMLYTAKCQLCHGIKGDGNGQAAAYLGAKPADFTDPGFWREHDDNKIEHVIENGQSEMPAFELKRGEIKAIINYLHTFNQAAKQGGI